MNRIMEEKTFTLGEANSLVTLLKGLLTEVRKERKILAEIEGEIKKASARAPFDGGSPSGGRFIHALERIAKNVERIHEMGIFVKDLDKGLCDFPYLRDGRVVYLCWKLGEDRIEWWHEVTDGYAGRQPLDEE